MIQERTGRPVYLARGLLNILSASCNLFLGGLMSRWSKYLGLALLVGSILCGLTLSFYG